eukprot:9246827-Pyramimonas_sp.AAC.1
MIILGTQMVSLKKAVEDRRAENPGVSVCYHAIEPASGELGHFMLKVKGRVVCTLATTNTVEDDDGGEGGGPRVRATQSNAANMVPLEVWASTNIAKMMWNMRWVQSGLMPQRPQARHDQI